MATEGYAGLEGGNKGLKWVTKDYREVIGS